MAKLEKVLQTWKGVSARDINRRLGLRGTLWQQESRDTSIRNEDHLIRSYRYIFDNPEKAKLREGEYFYYEFPGMKSQVRGDRA